MRSRLLSELTNREVRAYLDAGPGRVLVPVGSTEDHGDHGPLGTDNLIPTEVCRRAADELDALVAPAVPYGLAADHRGASGLAYLRLPTFVAVIGDLCRTLARSGFRRIALVNGHYVNTWAMQYAVSEVFDELPGEVRVYPFPYWQGLPPERAAQYLGGDVGIHANEGETAAVLAIDERLCDMAHVRDHTPDLVAGLRTSPWAVLDPLCLATPGAFWALVGPEGGGVWGTPSVATAARGEELLDWCRQAVVDLFWDLELMHDRLRPRLGQPS
jgi:creatinine amidohydrolase